MTSNKNFYLTILELLKEGKNPTQISKELNISKQKISYYTTTLKQLGFIEKKGYGVWNILKSKKIDLEHAIKWKDKKIRGHAFIWKVKSKQFNWINLLNKNNITYSLVRGYTPRIFINNQKVWLCKDSIIVYDNHSFYGSNAIESRKYAVYGLKSILEALSKQLSISLGKYIFRPSREHYGMIKNELARQCNEKGEKIIVKDDLDGEWLWIDDSEGMLGELETGGKGITKDRAGLNLEVQNWWNNHKETNFKVTPTFLLESINQVTQNQLMFNQNFESHIEAIQTLSSAVKELQNEVRRLNGN